MLLPQECGRSGSGSKRSRHRSGQNFTVLFACIRHYFPRQGGNLNCAGAHHGTLTPPRISRSCVQEYPNHRNHVNYIECCPQKRSCNCKVKYKLKSQALIKGRHLKRPFLTTFGTLTHSSFFGPNWWRCQDLYAKRILCSG